MAHQSTSYSLHDALADVLPKDVRLQIRHFSTPPTPCPALFSALPGEEEETTFCESQFLVASINGPETAGREVVVFAVEVLVYSTEGLTTLFVSKADSTGHLHLLKTPKGSPSVIRSVISAFLRYLVQCRQRPHARLVLSLFARSQDQYLFPGSIENPEKHVLDDRELVKWWCRVVDPIMREYEVEKSKTVSNESKTTATAYLITPGCDKYETRLFFPSTARFDPPDSVRWHNSHPLYQIAKNPGGPPRTLVPHFPDDPKARFLDALDDEIIDIAPKESPTKRGANGQWRTVKSLEQFWDMMAYRQECAAGRLVGFLWVVFTPPNLEDAIEGTTKGPTIELPTPEQSQNQGPLLSDLGVVPPLPPPSSEPLSPIPSSPIPSTVDVPLTQPSQDQKGESCHEPHAHDCETSSDKLPTDLPETSRYYYWPKSSRPPAILSDADYERIGDMLLRLDFAGLDLAVDSTKKLINEIEKRVKQVDWGMIIVGRKDLEQSLNNLQPTGVNIISSGMIRKRKKPSADTNGTAEDGAAVSTDKQHVTISNGVNVLGAGLVRKKMKT